MHSNYVSVLIGADPGGECVLGVRNLGGILPAPKDRKEKKHSACARKLVIF